MENNLTPRTYTTPTCTLIVSSKEEQQSPGQQPPTDFSLHLDSPDGDELDRITLAGQPQQLEYLHQIVSQYIADTIAKFPRPTAPNIPPAPSEPARIEIDKTSPIDRAHPDLDISSSRLGILKNLPGLRNSLAKFVPTTSKNLQSDLDSKPSISKLISGRNNPIDRTGQLNEIAQPATSSASQDAATTPYLTGTGNRSLDHQLYLGNLATPTSGEVLTLSAIQLFDLATVLEEYVAERLSASDPRDRPATLSRANIPAHGNRAAAGTTAIPLRLPNLPNIPAAPAVSQVYDRTRRSQSSFMSGIPWAVAAALAVGVPLLLLDPNSNPLKDAASKLNTPGLTGSKKSDLAVKKSDPAAVPDITATAPTVSSPTPWQAQPVSPPPVRSPDPSVKIPENPSQIGLAPLPDAIATNRGNLPMTAASSGNVKQSIAPNPLNSAPLPSAKDPIDNTTPPARVVPSKTPARQPGLSVTASPNKGANSGKLSVSKRPMLIPSSDLPPIVNPSNSPIPFNPPEMELPTGQNPQTPKTNQTAQPSPDTSQPNRVSPTQTGVNPSPSFEPITPVPRNPNLINPDQINTQSPDPQNPPIVPDKPLQSNASGAFAEGAESASLQEAKRYFQGKWKPNATQVNSLQYVLQISGKSGIVRTVSPQGDAATTYLQQTKFIKPGQKLISPAAASSSDQKIRVLLQPDGNVDTFTEP